MKLATRFAPMRYAQEAAVAAHKDGKKAISKQSTLRLAVALEHYVRLAPQRYATAVLRITANTIGLMLPISDADETRREDFARLQAVVAVHPSLQIVEVEQVQGSMMWQITWDGILLPEKLDQIAEELIAGAQADPVKSSCYERAQSVSQAIKASQDAFGTFAVELTSVPSVTIGGEVSDYLLLRLPGDWPA